MQADANDKHEFRALVAFRLDFDCSLTKIEKSQKSQKRI
jgi:hypothetical protein